MIISKTPLRCSFFGGGTDFVDYYKNAKYGYGTVLTTALNMYVYIMVSKRFDDKIRVCYTKNEFVDRLDQVEHNIVRESLRLMGIEKGIEIMYSADIPLSSAGVGLASSSALAVGVLNALHAFKGEFVSNEQIAKEACVIEIDKIGSPMGIQDQYACACGGFKQYKFFCDSSVVCTEAPVSTEKKKKLKESLLLYFTGLTRFSGMILEEQKNNIKNQTNRLDKMVEITEKAVQIARDGNLDEWGNMLDEVWQEKKKYASNVSNKEIDKMYEKAKNAGALGGKILGAGGGGFLLLYVSKDKRDQVKNALIDYKEVDFEFEPEGSRIIFMEEKRR